MGSKVSVANNQMSVNWDNLTNVESLVQNNPSKKPILVIQTKQITDQAIGADFPLLREAIETEFLVGKESTDAQGYRILDFSGKVLIPQDANFAVLNVVHSLTKALELSNKEIPQYLKLLQYDLEIETSKNNFDRATFSMGCYWQGEVRLGQLDGVLQTEAGWWLSDEIVGVIFDSKKLSYSDLVRHAHNNHFGVYAHDKSQAQDIKGLQLGIKMKERDPKVLARGVSEGERKYHLKQNQVLRFLPLIPSQAAKVNSSVGTSNGDHWKHYLSPRQIQYVKEIKTALGDERKARLLAKLGPCNHQLASVANYDAQLSSIVM